MRQNQGPTSKRAAMDTAMIVGPICRLFLPLLSMAVIAAVSAAVVPEKMRGLSDARHYLTVALLAISLFAPGVLVLIFLRERHHLAQRRRLERELTAERTKLREVLEAIPFGVCIVNDSHQIEYANGKLLKEFGPVEGRRCREYLRKSAKVCLDCPLTEPGGQDGLFWESICEPEGKTFEILETTLLQGEGKPANLVMVRDITVRKKGEERLRASRQRLRFLNEHHQRSREEERTAISREIHDELGQVLATVQLGVSSLAEEYPDHGPLTRKVAGMKLLLGAAIKTVQRIATQLRPALLDGLGLAEAIEWETKEFSARTGIDATADILLQDQTVGKDIATAIFRIYQEALRNVLRHSKATKVAVTLEERNRRIILVVADNGCGIVPEQLRGSRSLGITGMRERAFALGGRVGLRRSPHGGTIVIAHIPIRTQREGHE